MKNGIAVTTLSVQLSEVAKRMESISIMTDQIEASNASVSGLAEELLLDELNHAQVIVLTLTSLISGNDENTAGVNTDEAGDGGVFAEGELEHVKGEEKTPKSPTMSK